MTKFEIAEFTCKATDNVHCSENDDRVKNFLKEYDNNEKGYLEKKDFVRFYSLASRNKSSTVWENIKSLGYGKDLKLKNTKQINQLMDYSKTVRYKIINEGESFILSLLEDYSKLASYLLSLLSEIRATEMTGEQLKEVTPMINCMRTWAQDLQNFLYTLPPSIKIMENLLFGRDIRYLDLQNCLEVGYYELVILNSFIFNQQTIIHILSIFSETSNMENITSNENLFEGCYNFIFQKYVFK